MKYFSNTDNKNYFWFKYKMKYEIHERTSYLYKSVFDIDFIFCPLAINQNVNLIKLQLFSIHFA